MENKYKLFIPGPVDVPDDVLELMSTPCRPHYGDEWLALYNDTIAALQQVFGTKNDIFIIPGAGSAALEAAIGSLLAPGEKALILVNGFFSERFGVIARACGIETTTVAVRWGEPVLPAQVEEALDADPEIKAVAVVHHETSTGVLNPLEEITAVVHAHGLPIVVDAVSSIGGVPLPVDEWQIECCATVANKCLETPPGIGMVSVSDRAWEMITARADRHRGWYLNLNVWHAYSQEWDWHPYPTTVPTNLITALNYSLHKILAEGLDARYARFAEVARAVRQGLRELGFSTLVSEPYASPLVTAVQGQSGIPADEVARFLRESHGLLVGGGIGPLSGKIFRVGHMGKAMTDEYVNCFLAAVRDLISRRSSQA